MTALIAVPLSVGLGLLAALYRNTWFDRGINMISLVSISFPEFFIAYIAIVLLASPLGWKILPSLATVQDDASLGERIYRCALPAITMTLVIVAHMMRMTRAAIINVLASPYVEMARLKGAKPWQIIVRHALPNAWAPIVTVIALNLAYLVVGVVVVEFVFTYPGMGKQMVDAVTARDVPVVQACALVFAATYIILNLIADVLGIVTNPRLLHPK
jgi:peptide/nickel transport system permease protein